jgi:hypothetical protein
MRPGADVELQHLLNELLATSAVPAWADFCSGVCHTTPVRHRAPGAADLRASRRPRREHLHERLDEIAGKNLTLEEALAEIDRFSDERAPAGPMLDLATALAAGVRVPCDRRNGRCEDAALQRVLTALSGRLTLKIDGIWL